MSATALRVAVALCSTASATFAQQGEETIARVRSLVPFVVPAQRSELAMGAALPGEFFGEVPRSLFWQPEARPPQWVVGLLAARHHAAIDAGRLAVDLSQAAAKREADAAPSPGTNLLLRGRANDVDTCTRELDAIGAAMGRPIEVTAWRLPLGDGALPATTWDAPALQQALQRTPPLWTSRARARPGTAMRLGQERGIGYLRDLDVEVANASRITDPKTDVAFAGLRVGLSVYSLPGDDLVLAGEWLLSDPVALHEQSIGVGAGSIDLPEHRTASLSFAGRIASGGALVVAGRGGSIGPEGFVLVVGAKYLAPPPGDVAPDLLVRPVGALLAGRAVWRPELGWRAPGDDSPGFAMVPSDGGLTGTDLLQLLAAEPATAEVLEGLLLVHGDVDGCRRSEALLRQLFAALRNVAVQSRVVGDGAPALEYVQPALADRMVSAFVGRERAVLRDHEVEIAEKAQAANPVIGIAYSGLWSHATVAATTAGLHVAGVWSLAAHDPPRVRQHTEKPPMTMQMVDYRITVLPWDAPMAANQEHALGDGPAWTATGAPTRVTVRLIAP